MKEIGGYFELELDKGEGFHRNAIHLNSGRNAFEYILRAKQYKKVYLPYYTCDVMLEPIQKLNLEVQFYSIDETFRPIFDFSILNKFDAFVYTNYFGVCDKQVLEVHKKCKNLIIDNAQAFYSRPLPGVDTFYSPRKFFGISDGAYLYTDTKLDQALEKDMSHTRFGHLIKRIDISAADGYEDFVSNDKSLENNSIKIMSTLTSKILASINYNEIATKRKENFEYLNKDLTERNPLKFDLKTIGVPMVYPFWGTEGLRAKLLEHKVYTAKYWPNTKEWYDKNSLEYKMTSKLIHLPIDQRYGKTEMDIILKYLK